MPTLSEKNEARERAITGEAEYISLGPPTLAERRERYENVLANLEATTPDSDIEGDIDIDI